MLIDEYTDTGKKRDVNEDYCGKWHNNYIKGHIFCVADGMGGYGFGEMASKIAVHSILKDFAVLRNHVFSTRQLLISMFDNVQKRLNRYKVKKKIEIYGTTLAVLLVLGDSIACANLGDTRIYSLTHSDLDQVSFDHNFVQELLHAGEITPEQAEAHPKKHMLTRALTGDTENDSEPFITFSNHKPNILYLIATDGLYRMLEKNEIIELMQAGKESRSTESIIQKVYDRGAVDNITFQIIKPIGDS